MYNSVLRIPQRRYNGKPARFSAEIRWLSIWRNEYHRSNAWVFRRQIRWIYARDYEKLVGCVQSNRRFVLSRIYYLFLVWYRQKNRLKLHPLNYLPSFFCCQSLYFFLLFNFLDFFSCLVALIQSFYDFFYSLLIII